MYMYRSIKKNTIAEREIVVGEWNLTILRKTDQVAYASILMGNFKDFVFPFYDSLSLSQIVGASHSDR